MRTAIIALLSFGAAAACDAAPDPAPAKGDLLVPESRANQVLVDAAAEAKKTLPTFWAKFKAPAGAEKFKVKVALPTQHDSVEAIWMDVQEHDGTEIIGPLQNEPFDLGKLKLGSVISADESLVQDWSYIKDGKLYGGYSIRALMDSAKPEDRAKVSAALSATPLEPGSR
jgi:uncharacterized protein YegJ (DUF2314 family)